MQKLKRNLTEILAVSTLFGLLIAISYYQIDQSLSITKYHFQWTVSRLLENYTLYQQSFQEFLFRTCAFHTASSMEGWSTVVYLWPLFLFCNILQGGLSVKGAYLFVITSSLVFVGLFYWWVRGVWGKQAALYAAFFLGFSSVFQDIARTGTYHTYSLVIGILWVMFFFHCSKSNKIGNYFLLGLFTGLTWYGYGTLRYLTIVVFFYSLFLKIPRKFLIITALLAGIILVLLPGFLIRMEMRHINLTQFQKPKYLLFFDQAASFKNSNTIKNISSNIKKFGAGILMIPKINHPYIWNPFLGIPLLIGLGSAVRSRKHLKNRLLLLLAFVVYLAPCLILENIYLKRLLIYIIPSYCLIGLGMKEIVTWIHTIRSVLFKYVLALLLSSYVFMILFKETTLFQKNLLPQPQKIPVVFLGFVNKIKEMGTCGNIYYFEGGQSSFQATGEIPLMSVALLKNGKSCLTVINGKRGSKPLDMSQNNYISRGPNSSNQEFDDWCMRNNVTATLLFESPIKNGGHLKETKSFKFYTVQPRIKIHTRNIDASISFLFSERK